ncbi:unnamed protein product, partial [Rotaria sp. Silwood2]
REYSILHSTLADLFEQIDYNTRRTLNELEYVLNELTNIKLFYSSTQNGTQIHLHHHHHHIYHHLSTPSEHYYNRLDKQSNDNRSSPYGSQISLSLTGTGTTNESSQGYHSISTSPIITTVENINKENIRTPLSFKNPLFNNHTIEIEENNQSDLSDDDSQINLNQTQTDSSKALYFINNLCIESLKTPSSPSSSSQQSLVHSASRQSLQQPLFVLNNSYMTRSTQSLASSSNINTPITTNNSSSTYYCVKTHDQLNGTNKRQSILSNQQLPPPPKMGLKALNHTSSSNKDIVLAQRSPMLNLYQEEKCRRIECEKQAERLRNELNRSNEQIEEYRHLIHLLNEKNSTTNIDDINLIDYSDDDDDDDIDVDVDIRPIEKNFCLDDNTENKFIFLYSKPPLPPNDDDDDIDDLSILSHLENAIE